MLKQACILLTMAAACSACVRTAVWTKKCSGKNVFRHVTPYVMWPLPSCPEELGIRFITYNRRTGNRGVPITRWKIPGKFHKGARTVFLVHGNSTSGTNWLKPVKRALLRKGKFNVILVTWNTRNKTYGQAASDMRALGRQLQFVANNLMMKRRVKRRQIWCIGHGLGAQACGISGKVVPLGRITGLDPSGPLFERNPKAGLEMRNADFVDVIHTDGVGNGMMRPVGHVDFYPNGGQDQPACRKYHNLTNRHKCNHREAVEYFKLSLVNRGQCRTYERCWVYTDIPRSCKRWRSQIMGYSSETRAGRGAYYLKVDIQEPCCP
ncbi:Inactive pancreatic lipase-related protein 1 [Lamellibrachia satsuma]|nr:Inactive pancreatic lipase-related protein 1 [Lamellibrachia satsuma]